MSTMRHQPGMHASLVALVCGFSFVCVAASNVISYGTAKSLVLEALVAIGQKPRAFDIENRLDPNAPDFYSFSATWYDPPAPFVAYYFALNPATGDVWDTVMCRRITSPAIRKAQESIQGRLKVSAEVWKNLTARSPGYSEEKQASDEKPK